MGANGLKEFVMLPEWTVNNFRFTIKEVHFKTIKAIYQISVYPISQKNVITTEWTT